MTQPESPYGPKNIGDEATPPFAVLPDPAALFLSRSKRLRELAPGHVLETYLHFVADVTFAQHETQASLPPPVLDAGEFRLALEHFPIKWIPLERQEMRPNKDLEPRSDAIGTEKALEYAMPPVSRSTFEPGEAEEATLIRLLDRLSKRAVPDEAAQAIKALRAASADDRRSLMRDALLDAPAVNVAERVFVLAGLQVAFARLAASLGDVKLRPVADSVCPVCGSPPMTSSVVGWPKAHNSRFCACSLCGAMWNVVRVKCVLCGSTEGVAYQTIEGQPETVKAETCDKCGRYVKILYQVKDHRLDPLGDDVASLGLDALLAQEGWERGGDNLFLLGY